MTVTNEFQLNFTNIRLGEIQRILGFTEETHELDAADNLYGALIDYIHKNDPDKVISETMNRVIRQLVQVKKVLEIMGE